MEFLVPNKKTTGKLGKCREAWLNITNVKLTISKHWYIPARLGWFIRGAFTTMRTKTITRRSLRPGMMEDARKSFSAFLLCFRAEGEAHEASLIPRLDVKSTSSLLKILQDHNSPLYPIPAPPRYHCVVITRFVESRLVWAGLGSG